jgi:hypothetical protein
MTTPSEFDPLAIYRKELLEPELKSDFLNLGANRIQFETSLEPIVVIGSYHFP